MPKTASRAAYSTTRSRRPLEKHVVKAILDYLNSIEGCYAIKTHGGQWSSGQPDIIGCLDGQALALEVKRPKAKPTCLPIYLRHTREDWIKAGATELQAATLEKWQRAGAIVGVVTSVEETKRLLGLEDE